MLEFIVLGQVPGTGLYISFIEFLALSVCIITAALCVVAIQLHRNKTKQTQNIIEQQTI